MTRQWLALAAAPFSMSIAASASAQELDNDLVIQPAIAQDYNRGRNVSVAEQPRPDYSAIGLNLGGAQVLDGGGAPLLGAAVLSPTGAAGQAATVGLLSNGQPVAVNVTSPSPITGVTNTVAGVVNTATSTAGSALGQTGGAAGGLGGVTGTVTGTVGAVTGTVGNVVGSVLGATPVGGTVGGLTGGIGVGAGGAVSGSGASGGVAAGAGGTTGALTGTVGGLVGGLLGGKNP